MLTQKYDTQLVARVLLPRELWHPYPACTERNYWKNVVPSVWRAHINRGEQALGCKWPELQATLFLEFSRTGNRRNFEKQSFLRREMLCNLVVAECLEGEGRFLDDIANGIWAICEESFWGIPACMYMQKAGVGLPDVAEPVVPLFVGETVNLLAWIVYLLGPQLNEVSPLIVPRILRESDWRVLTPCYERDDFWWMGYGNRSVNNWNPWVSSNWLAANLLLEQNAERRTCVIYKIMQCLDHFIDSYPEDGGCDEGPGYWGRAGASLFDCLELLFSATDGAIDIFDEPLIQEIGRYIYRVHIQDRYFVNFADAPALTLPSAPIVFRYGQRIQDEEMMAFGAWCAREHKIGERGLSDNLSRQLQGFQILPALLQAKDRQPLIRDVWFPEIQVMTARDFAGSSDGFFVAAKGGHNAESHNHNDIGNFIVYIDGKPVLIDAGVETYTAKTFSAERYEIWTMQSEYHNVPAINGVQQMQGKAFAAKSVAYRADDEEAELTLDIAGAYPADAEVAHWIRTVKLVRGNGVVVTDAYDLEAVTDPLQLVFMTPCKVALEKEGRLDLSQIALPGNRWTGAACLLFDTHSFNVETDIFEIEDERLKIVWGNHLCRVKMTAKSPSTKGKWEIQIRLPDF